MPFGCEGLCPGIITVFGEKVPTSPMPFGCEGLCPNGLKLETLTEKVMSPMPFGCEGLCPTPGRLGPVRHVAVTNAFRL